MFTLVIANRKGGSAKTTTAVNLAAEYAQQGRRCLLIDLDAQCHSALGLGVKPHTPGSHWQSLLENGRQRLFSLLHSTSVDNLFYIPAGLSRGGNAKAQRLQQFLARKQLQQHFDLVIMDTPPHAGIEQDAALLAADALVIPFQLTPLGREGVAQLVNDLQLASKSRQRPLSFGLIPIMLDNRVNLDRQVLAEIIREYGQQRLLRGVRRNVSLAEAFDAGAPVNQFAARSRGAFDYHMLADDIARLWPDILPRQDTLSFRHRAEVSTLPVVTRKNQPAPEQPHRGIRLKKNCRQWHN